MSHNSNKNKLTLKLFTDRIRVLELSGATVPEIYDQFCTKHGCAHKFVFLDLETRTGLAIFYFRQCGE